MSSQQGPPSRPWFRLATMVRPPPPPPAPAPAPAAAPVQPNPPPRPAFVRPTFTPIPPPPQTTSIPPPQQPTQTAPSQQPNPTPSPPRIIPRQVPSINVVEPPPQPTLPRPTPPAVPTTNVVEPQAPPPSSSDPPASPARKQVQFSRPTTLPQQSPLPNEAISSPPPSLTTTRTSTTTTRDVSPPSSPPKIVKPLEQSPQLLPLSPPKRSHLSPSPPSSPPRPPIMRKSEHPSPQSSPPKTITLPEKTSPLMLPSHKEKNYNESPPQYMQKNMLVQETKEKPKNSTTSYNGRHTSRKHETHKKQWDSEDAAGKNTITIAGENKGAIMNITAFGGKKHEVGNKFNITGDNPITSSNGETPEIDSKEKNKNQNSNTLLKTSFLNSNVQGVNNSILYNCAIDHHDPGIRLTLSRKSDGDFGFHSKEHKK